MKIEHIAIWVNDLEGMRSFYQTYFNMQCSKKYQNSDKGFSSYFLSFDSGARLEIMKKKDIINETKNKGITNGLTHLAISMGSKEAVDTCTRLFTARWFHHIRRTKNNRRRVLREYYT